jgi:group II intron reverse transcriptase/maturase
MAPNHTQRSIEANAGRPTGGDAQGRGPPIVVRDGNAVHRAKGQPTKVGQSAPLIQERRGGIVQVPKTEVCAMQDADVYLGLVHERGKKGLPLERVYRQLFNRNLYLKAYGKLYRNAGVLTKGVNEDTIDGMSLEKIDAIIETLRYERYHWKPARRISIPKKDGKQRPLGLPVWSDKLLGEVVRMILSAYFEPTFSDHSHGFREGRGCHTALREIYYGWSGTTYFIEGDISGCFNNLDHELLISALSEHIHDGRFINLIRSLLKAGYLEAWKFNRTLSGVPQGSVVSPVLSNILLDKLDKFVETVLTPQYTKGIKRQRNPEYRHLMGQARKHYQKGETEQAAHYRKRAQQLPSVDTHDPNFRRLRYCRYADDWLIGFVGPKSEAEEIKLHLEIFLREELHLELSKTKTLITHARSQAARFLGYDITTIQKNAKRTKNVARGTKGRSVNGRIGLRVPPEVLKDKCDRYKRNQKIRHRPEMENDSDFTIMGHYQMEYRGMVQYYRLAYNLHTLDLLRWVMEVSLTKTLAHKHKTSVQKMCDKYKAQWEENGTAHRGLRVVIPRAGKKPLIATWGGISLQWDIKATLNDQPPHQTMGRSELEKRLLAQVCEQCGATSLTDPIEVHHIRALKDLENYPGREKPRWVKIMAARRRKTLILCRTCHQDVQYGRPMRRQKSSS